MDFAENADKYVQREYCFVNRSGGSFDVERNLKSLRATAFGPLSNCLTDEGDQHSYTLPVNGIDFQEPDDQPALLLRNLEQACKDLDASHQMLPKWNYSYRNLTVSSELLDIGFHAELDLAKYMHQVQS
ncbi:hypothetical protein UVI_02006310 [Ustilaginoidea virens]|uniref:Uncharacterized protein n=1 Tax=Ustilaginoidea virens TaxID=1159556 RepID=A0A1B5L2T0_USTVR|nr:hypothetical protein UVI_02006310 [Ustilaginoidea virens]